MAQNLASLKLTAADATAIRSAITTIRTTLGTRGVSLTTEQRSNLSKMGDKTRNFCQQAVAALQANASSLPPDFALAELVQDLADFELLFPMYAEFTTLGELLDDTLKAVSSDIMVASTLGVGMLKMINQINPKLNTLLKDLSSVRRAKAKKKPPTT